MKEAFSCPKSERSLDQEFSDVTGSCPGCLINCYMMEETIGFTGNTFRERLFNLALLILELPTIIQMAKVTANREKSGWGAYRDNP